MKIKFCVAAKTGKEMNYISEAINSGQLAGDGVFSLKCHDWFERHLKVPRALLTPSCTHALEMAAVLIGIEPDDEVIMPSYTFVSTANAFVLRGAKIVFVDVEAGSWNIDHTKIEAAITERTKAIVPVHYAGVACEMDEIMKIARQHNLYVVEDAAQGMMSSYKGRPLGTIGDFGAISFHTTKNFTSGGEGGLFIVNNEKFLHRAEMFREKGTDRSAFFRGEVDKYTWRDVGSSMLPSEIQAAYLWGQLEGIEELNSKRLAVWQKYFDSFEKTDIAHSENIDSTVKSSNGHIFYVMGNARNRDFLPKFRQRGIQATSHYEPLHSSAMGEMHGRVVGSMKETEYVSSRIIRLPIYASLDCEEIEFIIQAARDILS